MSSKEHYETLLAARYAWMRGPSEPIVKADTAKLRRLGIREADDQQTAVDLGAGTGVHCRMLLGLGYRVVAVDNSPTILRTLEDIPVERIEADLVTFDPKDAVLIVCMGDTLTHLPDRHALQHILHKWQPGRTLVLSFRNLNPPRVDLDRFLLVRSDADRIHTCFLEDAGAHIRVHDLFHERHDDGTWTLKKSAYLKLRIQPAEVVQELEKSGATVTTDDEGGMVTIVAR